MIFIPFDKHKSIGGPATFLRNLQAYMDGTGRPYRERYQKGDSIFFTISYDVRMLKKVKKHGGGIIQRLDGVYYPSLHGEQYKSRNEKIYAVYRDYTDVVVFQSNYSKLQCLEMFGASNERPDKIIHNGVDPAIFFPGEQPFDGNEPIEFITTGSFQAPLRLKPILDALDSLQKEFSFRLHICGPVKAHLTPLYADKSYVVTHGRQTLQGVARLLRKSHVFLFSNINPPCPNSVLEAVACGLPVVSFDSGALSEMLPFSTQLLAHVSSDVIQTIPDFRHELLAEKILFAVENLPQLRESARIHANDVAFAKCGNAYCKVFSSVAGN